MQAGVTVMAKGAGQKQTGLAGGGHESRAIVGPSGNGCNAGTGGGGGGGGVGGGGGWVGGVGGVGWWGGEVGRVGGMGRCDW